jgi:hypothetical protein
MAEPTPKRPSIAARLEAIESRPGGAFFSGFVLTVLLVGAMLMWWLVFGLWETLFDPVMPLGISFDGRNHVILVVVLVFVIVARRWVKREEERAFLRFGADSTLSREMLADEVRRTFLPTPAARVVSVGSGILIGTAIVALTSGDPRSFVTLAPWDAHHVWAIANNIVLFSVMVQSAFYATSALKTLGFILSSIPEVDLLDRDGMARIGRFGFPGSLVWLVGSSMASTLAWGMQTVWPLLTILSATLVIATFSLLRPVQIVHARLATAKEVELDRVRARIDAAKSSALAGDSTASSEASILAGLIAYESRIDSVREWPFDASTLVRFGVLSLLAVGSWLGGAVVERVLGAMLE